MKLLGLVSLIPDGTVITGTSFNIKFIADSVVVIIIALFLAAEPYRMMRGELGRLTGRRVDTELEDELRAAIEDELHTYSSLPGERITDLYVVRRGKSIEVQLCLGFDGTATLEQLDAVRDHAEVLFRDSYGAGRIYVMFAGYQIHETAAEGAPSAETPGHDR